MVWLFISLVIPIVFLVVVTEEYLLSKRFSVPTILNLQSLRCCNDDMVYLPEEQKSICVWCNTEIKED